MTISCSLFRPSFALVLSLLLAATAAVVSAQEMMTPVGINNPSGTIPSTVILPAQCIFREMIPKTQFTLEVSDIFRITSNPPNLVNARVQNGKLALQFNSQVSQTASVGGVVIGLPANALSVMEATGNANVMITDGFTSITKLSLAGNGVLIADLSSNQQPSLELVSTELATVQLKTTITEVDGGTFISSRNFLDVPNGKNFDLTAGASVRTEGNVNGGKCLNQSSLLSAGTIDGVWEQDFPDSSLTANVCDTSTAPTSPSTVVCSGGATDIAVGVDVSVKDPIRTGTQVCTSGPSDGADSNIEFSEEFNDQGEVISDVTGNTEAEAETGNTEIGATEAENLVIDEPETGTTEVENTDKCECGGTRNTRQACCDVATEDTGVDLDEEDSIGNETLAEDEIDDEEETSAPATNSSTTDSGLTTVDTTVVEDGKEEDDASLTLTADALLGNDSSAVSKGLSAVVAILSTAFIGLVVA